MKYNGIIQRKLSLLDKHLLHLQNEVVDIDLASFKANWVVQRMVERVLQIMIEIVIDIAERILAVSNAGPAATAVEAVDKLVELGVIQSAEPYAEIIRFRNFIVHQYEEIDSDILFDIVKTRLGAFRQFRDEVDRA